MWHMACGRVTGALTKQHTAPSAAASVAREPQGKAQLAVALDENAVPWFTSVGAGCRPHGSKSHHTEPPGGSAGDTPAQPSPASVVSTTQTLRGGKGGAWQLEGLHLNASRNQAERAPDQGWEGGFTTGHGLKRRGQPLPQQWRPCCFLLRASTPSPPDPAGRGSKVLSP